MVTGEPAKIPTDALRKSVLNLNKDVCYYSVLDIVRARLSSNQRYAACMLPIVDRRPTAYVCVVRHILHALLYLLEELGTKQMLIRKNMTIDHVMRIGNTSKLARTFFRNTYSTTVQLTDSSDVGRRRRPSMRQFQAPSLVQSLFICELCLTTG